MSWEFEVIDAIVQALRQITGLHPEYGPTPRMQTPAVIPLMNVDHNSAWGDYTGQISGTLFVIFAWGVLDRDGARLMYDYTAPVGDKSITAKLMNTHTADGALPTTAEPTGVVAGIRVGAALMPKAYNFGDGTLYWGREIPFKIWPKES